MNDRQEKKREEKGREGPGLVRITRRVQKVVEMNVVELREERKRRKVVCSLEFPHPIGHRLVSTMQKTMNWGSCNLD